MIKEFIIFYNENQILEILLELSTLSIQVNFINPFISI